MRRETRLWMLLALGVCLFLLLLVWTAPGWGMPDQNVMRQTVPTRTPAPTLVPWAYLPLVVKNTSGPVR